MSVGTTLGLRPFDSAKAITMNIGKVNRHTFDCILFNGARVFSFHFQTLLKCERYGKKIGQGKPVVAVKEDGLKDEKVVQEDMY